MMRDRTKEMSMKYKRLEEQSVGQKPGTRLANPAQEQPSKMLVVELKMEQPAAQALVYVSFVAMLHTGAREGEQEQRRQEAGVSRSEDVPQSMKISERVTRTATRSDTKLYKARERAEGLK